MKPPPFAYHRPETREEVDRLLAEHGDEAKILAGGQSLIPILNMRLSAPAHLIDINGLADEPARAGDRRRRDPLRAARPPGRGRALAATWPRWRR